MPDHGQTQRHHTSAAQQKRLEQLADLQGEHGGDDARHTGRIAGRREPIEGPQQVMFIVRVVDQCPRRDTAHQGRGHAQKVGPGILCQVHLLLDSRADAVEISKAGADLGQGDSHRWGQPFLLTLHHATTVTSGDDANNGWRGAVTPLATRVDTFAPQGTGRTALGGILELRLPQAMEVAVGVDDAGLDATREERGRGLAGLEVMDLQAAGGLERDPLDVVRVLHGVLDLTDGHVQDVALTLELDDGDVLLDRGVDGVGDNLGVTGRSDHVGVDGGEELARLVILEKRSHMYQSFQTSLQMQPFPSMPEWTRVLHETRVHGTHSPTSDRPG